SHSGFRQRGRYAPRGRLPSGVLGHHRSQVRERFADVGLKKLDEGRVAQCRRDELTRAALLDVRVVEDLAEVPAAPVLAVDVREQPLLAKRLAPTEEVRRALEQIRASHRTTRVARGCLFECTQARASA